MAVVHNEGDAYIMSDEKIEKHIKKLSSQVKNLLNKENNTPKAIHKIRIKSREIISLLESQQLYSPSIKKIIKTSNKLRDLDVLINEYFVNLPKGYYKLVNLEKIKENVIELRNKEYKKFLAYLKEFTSFEIGFVHKEISKIDKANKYNFLPYEKKELHQYRIFIKRLLYIEKSKEQKDKYKIKLLTQIKNNLGIINDNRNAMKVIKKLAQNKREIKKLTQYTEKQNIHLFEKTQKVALKLGLIKSIQ